MSLESHRGHAVRAIETQTVSVYADLLPASDHWLTVSDEERDELVVIVYDTDQGMGHSDYRAWVCDTCGVDLDDEEVNRLEVDYA